MTTPNTISIVSRDILCHMNKKFYSTSVLNLRAKFPQFSDEDIARFLCARDGLVDKAEEMLKAHVAWRASNYPIYKDDCLGEILKGKVYVHGTDKEGHPLIHFRPRLNDADVRDVEEMGRMALWWVEVIFKQVRLPSVRCGLPCAVFVRFAWCKCGRDLCALQLISLLRSLPPLPLTRSCCLSTAVDLQIPPHFTKATLLVNRTGGESNADVPFIRQLASVFQANHPERLYKAVIYPSGVVFWMLWNMLKHLADPVTQAKISPVMWQSGVKDSIADEFIPKEIGRCYECGVCAAYRESWTISGILTSPPTQAALASTTWSSTPTRRA